MSYATRPDYKSSIAWVEKHSSTNNLVTNEKLYVASVPGDPPASATIIAFTNGVSLRLVIDQTRYKESDTQVTVLRSSNSNPFVFEALVKAKEKTDFKLQPGDMIWLSKTGIPWK
jgi:hypothetical protein